MGYPNIPFGSSESDPNIVIPHAGNHEDGGSDEIDVAGLSGLLADDQHVLDAEVQAISINNLIEDTTPQLGGDLDCNTHAITSPTDPTDEHGVGTRGFTDGRYPLITDFQPPAPVAFAGSDGHTITHNYGHTNYQLIINPVADPGGFLGEIWFVKSDNTVVVYNSGTASGNFDYVITPAS